MGLTRKVTVQMFADTDTANAKLKAIDAEARKLGELNPEIKVKLESAAATAKMAVLRAELKSAGTESETASGKFGIFGKALGGLAGAGSSLAPVLGSSATLIGAVAVAAAGAVVALGPLIAALAVTAAGFIGFAAIAVPMIGKVITARTALQKAEAQYDAATTKAQRAAALKAEAAATDGLTSAQKGLLGPMDQIAKQFHKLTAAVQPEVTKAFAEVLRIIKDLMPALTPLVVAAGKALDKLFKNMADWLESPSGKKFIRWLEVAGPKDIANFGKFLWTFAQDAGKAFKWIVDKGTSLDKLLAERWRDIKVVSQDLRNWIWRDFVQKISNFFTNTIPSAAALLRDKVHLIWDQMIIHALHFLLNLTVAFGHLPGKLGQPFRDASAAIRTELGHMADDVKRTVAKINDDWASLHGGNVLVQFKFPPGTISRLHQLHPGGFAAGTAGAAPGWAWTGERGPELVNFRGGETVLSHQQSRRVAGYASGTLPGFTDKVPSFPAIDRVAAAMQGLISRVVAGIQRVWGHIPAPPGFFRRPPGGAGVPGPGGGAPAANAALARRLFPQWATGANWAAWNAVEMAEAGWNNLARNPKSGAYGIPQALPPSKMGAAANPPQSNPTAQIRWMAGYMAGRYGGPQGAWAHERAFHWYGNGTASALPGWAVVGERGPEMVRFRGGEQVRPAAPVNVTIQLAGSGGGIWDRAFLQWIQQAVRVQGGGDVQVAFGAG